MENSSVKVFKNLCDDVIVFDTVDDFNNYYKLNKAEIDKLSTRGINQKYKVKSHRIGREKGNITLYPKKESNIIQQPQAPSLDVVDENGLTLHEKLNRLNNKLKNIENILNHLLNGIFEDQNDTNPRTQTQSNARFNPPYI